MSLIGDMNRKLLFYRQLDSGKDLAGQPQTEMALIGTHWGKIEPLTGRDLEVARQHFHLATHRVTARYKENLTQADEIRYRGRKFGILHVINKDERDRFTEYTCTEARTGTR